MQSLWIALLVGSVSSLIMTLGSLYLFPHFGWLDFPERYGLKRPRLPYPGGLGLGFLALVGLGAIPEFRTLLVPLALLLLLSWWDDRRQLSSWFRLLAHIWIALVIVQQGIMIYWISNPLADTNFALAEVAPMIAVALTIAWIVAIQNAMNWFDGLPGLNVGISGVGFLTLAVLGVVKPELWYDPDHFNLTLLNFYLAGLCVGAFLWYWQNKIILGDTGSQVLGWLLAVMAIFSGAKIATTLLVLSLPLLDMLWVMFRRAVLEKKSPLKGDLFHLHHLLAARSQAQLVTVGLVGCSLLLGLTAVLLPSDYKFFGFVVITGLVLSMNWWLWQHHEVIKKPSGKKAS